MSICHFGDIRCLLSLRSSLSSLNHSLRVKRRLRFFFLFTNQLLCQDMPGANIAQHLAECAEFMERALSMRCGMVFIASYMGNSRAATIAAAYLMLKKNYSATEALQYMRSTREVQPNFGFLQQLAELDNSLRKDRYRKYNYKLEEIKYSI